MDVGDFAVLATLERWLAVLDQESVRGLPGEICGYGGASVTVMRC